MSAELLGPDGAWQAIGEAAAGGGTETTPVAFQLSGLSPDTEYRARVVAVNEAGRSVGQEATLRTDPVRPAGGDAVADARQAACHARAARVPPGRGGAACRGGACCAAATSGSVSSSAGAEVLHGALSGIGALPPGTVLRCRPRPCPARLGPRAHGAAVRPVRRRALPHGAVHQGVGTVNLSLVGKLDCRKAKKTKKKSTAVASRKGKRKKSRKIWGLDDGGSFKTHGHDSVTTVRGTLWMTQDTCRGTRVKVLDGSVSVKPRRGGRARIVHAGEEILTPRKG